MILLCRKYQYAHRRNYKRKITLQFTTRRFVHDLEEFIINKTSHNPMSISEQVNTECVTFI